jgi:hypothetical protein
MASTSCRNELPGSGGAKKRQTHAERAPMHHLLEILDSFGHHIDPHVACQIDQGFDDGCRVAIGADGINKYLVDLDDRRNLRRGLLDDRGRRWYP